MDGMDSFLSEAGPVPALGAKNYRLMAEQEIALEDIFGTRDQKQVKRSKGCAFP